MKDKNKNQTVGDNLAESIMEQAKQRELRKRGQQMKGNHFLIVTYFLF